MTAARVVPRAVTRRVARAVACLAVLAALGGHAVVVAGPAQAAARVTVSGLGGAAQADPGGPTTLHLSGSGFQSVQGGFGGVYVLFGWVSDPAGGAWKPSRGGATGTTLRYIPDSEAASNAGYQRFVAFPGSSTAGEANGGVVAADGTWSAELVVPGATFQAHDRNGNEVSVNCLAVQCGVITIGAHGVTNATNETFTPVSFAGAQSSDAAGAAAGTGSADAGAATDSAGAGQGAAPAPAGTSTTAPTGEAGTAPATGEAPADDAQEPAATAPATLGVDKTTAVAGHVLAFTGQGFTPGEQVLATLDDGVVAVGPLTAGDHGEVAGLIELPRDLRVGTHVLTVSGAASGQAPQAELTVRRDPADVAAAEASAAATTGGPFGDYTVTDLVLAGAALLLLALLVSSAAASARRRGVRRKADRAARRAARDAEADGRGAADADAPAPDVAEASVSGAVQTREHVLVEP